MPGSRRGRRGGASTVMAGVTSLVDPGAARVGGTVDVDVVEVAVASGTSGSASGGGLS